MQLKLFGKVFYISKPLLWVVLSVLGVGVCLAGSFFMRQTEESIAIPTQIPQTIPVQTASPIPTGWQIYIVGAVERPGLYQLQEHALLYDAIQAAGGLNAQVLPEKINLAQELQPNLMIHILTEQERIEQERSSSLILILNNVEINDLQETQSLNAKININKAGKEGLMTLPGIGEAKAESIIAHREEYGPFQRIEDIMLVNGIKESAFEKIKDRITT